MENLKSSKLYAIISLYDMQTTYFRNVLDGISDDDTHNRLDTKANHIAWLSGSLVEQRYELARELGLDQKQTSSDLFKDNKGIQEDVKYPSLDVFRQDWDAISPILKEALLNLTDENLEKLIHMGPDMTFPLYDLITFISYREANVIGQIALWRRLLNYPAMKYM
ncbi:MAG: DinB family protein [Dyadobacter sp.]|uniref:DinB family protein n=1 Tax=Dyadobacter sp. TaxID=1914288 RepID=UPI00326765AF